MKLIRRIQRFDYAQVHDQTTENCWVLINISGLQKLEAALPSGQSAQTTKTDQPFAALLPEGSRFNFDYGEDRENWVIELQDGAVTEMDSGTVMLSLENGLNAEFPALASLDTIQAKRCLEYLTRILQDFHNPDPSARTSMDLAFYALLDCIIHPELPIHDEEPAEALRKRIIDDRGFVKNLSALSLECGYSPDHIRRLFEARFSTSPKSFRTDYRMHIARDLLRSSGLSIQEISDQLNYSHPAHFSAAFKKYYGQTPKAYKAAE